MIKAKTYTRSVHVPAAAPKRFRFGDVIAVLVVVVLAVVAVQYFMSGNSTAALAARAHSLLKGDLAQALANYKNDNGAYPTTRQGLKALVQAPDDATNWKGPYINADELKDPWNMPYQYAFPGRHSALGEYDAWSMGPDKRSSTADDVGNW